MERRGFTLIELLVVIAIIGLLSSVVLTSLNQARSKTRDAKRIQDLKQLEKALELYAANNGGLYPAVVRNGNQYGITCWDCSSAHPYSDTGRLAELEPYLKQRPTDPSLATNPLSLPAETAYAAPLPGAFNREGYWYKVGPISNFTGENLRRSYKIFLVGTVENTSNIPPSLVYTDFTFDGIMGPSMAISSSNESAGWTRDTIVYVDE